MNAYLRQTAGADFTAKDFRTWAGTVLVARELVKLGGFDSEAEAGRKLVAAVKEVAAELGNTPAVCRKCYVHPAVVQAYLEGRPVAGCGNGRRGCEAALLSMLEKGTQKA